MKSSFQLSLDYSTKQQQELSHVPESDSGLKEADDLHAKTEIDGQEPRVSFVEYKTHYLSNSRISEVIVETEIVDGDPNWFRNTTFIPKELVAPSALKELGYPFRDLSEEPLDTPQNRLRIPMLLTEKEVDLLIRLTKGMIIHRKG